MFKLVVISGSNRGTSYLIPMGELSIGRQTGNTVVLQSSKVSKFHCMLTREGEQIILKDLGSSNGTFVNGVLTKLRRVAPGDRISIGETVLEVVQSADRVNKVAPAFPGLGAGVGGALQFPSVPGAAGALYGGGHSSAMMGGLEGGPRTDQPPKDLKERVIWLFEHRVMPVFYALGIKHEWKLLSVGLFAVFMFGNLVISVYPLLDSSRATLVKETGRRARFMARQIAEANAPFIAARAETKTNVGIIESAEGVRLAALLDLDSRIIAPGTKMNEYLAVGEEAVVAVKARDLFRSGKETGFWQEAGEGMVVAVEPVRVTSSTAGKNVTAAMAVVSVDTTILTPDLGEIGMVYAETLIMTGLLGGLILLILYKITLKPFQVLNEDMDKALKGEISQVTHEYKLEEMNALWDIINSAIQRIPKKSDSGTMSGLGSSEEDLNVIAEFENPLKMIGSISRFGMIVFNAQMKIVYINPIFEEISGIRLDGAIGMGMSDVARDQSMGAFTDDILSRAFSGSEGISEDYDFSGISYKMHAAAFGSSGGRAKCYVLLAEKAEV